MLRVVGDTHPQHHFADERWIWQCLSARSKIFGEAEDQFIHAGGKCVALEQRFIASPILVRHDALKALPHDSVRSTFDSVDGDGNTCTGPA